VRTLLVVSAAQAEQPFAAFDDAPRFMLYVQKQVGAGRHQSMGPSFGFAIERPMLRDQSDSRSLQLSSAKLLDFRYAPDNGSLFFNGLQLTGKPSMVWASRVTAAHTPRCGGCAAGIAALLIGLCATDNDPCGDSDDDDTSTDTSRTPDEPRASDRARARDRERLHHATT
jgi:hypothetical protein